jgi:hypothetical protein
MPKRKKDKKRKKSKLTNKELLKIIKAIKPQNQQIVRVNVGDNRKKKGEVVPSINPPFVFPPSGFPAVVSYAQPKEPIAPTQALVAPSWNQQNISSQPQMQPLIMPPSSSGVTFKEAPLLLTDAEQTDVENIKVRPARRSRKKEQELAQGYSVIEPREPRFKPRMTRNSQFAEQSSRSFKISDEPSDNDPFMPVSIQTTSDFDQIGTIAPPPDSSQWVLTPEGNEPPLEEILQTQQIDLPVAQAFDTSAVDVFGEPVMPPMPPSLEEQKQEEEENIVVEPTKEEIQKAQQIKEIKSQTVASYLKPKRGQMIEDLNKALVSGEVDIATIPKAWIVTKGAQKGKIRDSIKVSDLQPYWDDLYVSRGGLLMGSK